MRLSIFWLAVVAVCNGAYAQSGGDLSGIRTEIYQIRMVEIAELRNEIANLRNEIAELRELTAPLKIQQMTDRARQHRDVCAYLHKEVKAGRLTKDDPAKIGCK